MAEQLFTISTVAFVLAAVFLLIAIVLWFRFGILAIINDLTGRTAKKSIELMRENNTKNGKMVFRMNVTSGGKSKRLTEKTAEMTVAQETDVTERLGQSQAEAVSAANETVLLGGNMDSIGKSKDDEVGATVLLKSTDDTELLVVDETVMLESDEPVTVSEHGQVRLEMLDDIMLIHTNEMI